MSISVDTAGGRQFAKGIKGGIASGMPEILSGVLAGSTALDFGELVVANATDGKVNLMTADADKILGISIRNPTGKPVAPGAEAKYPVGDTVAYTDDGIVWCQAVEDVRAHDQVLAIAASSYGLGGSKGGAATTGRVDVPGAKWLDTTALGALGRVQIKTVGTRRTTT